MKLGSLFGKIGAAFLLAGCCIFTPCDNCIEETSTKLPQGRALPALWHIGSDYLRNDRGDVSKLETFLKALDSMQNTKVVYIGPGGHKQKFDEFEGDKVYLTPILEFDNPRINCMYSTIVIKRRGSEEIRITHRTDKIKDCFETPENCIERHARDVYLVISDYVKRNS
jgi:hypothetical protein